MQETISTHLREIDGVLEIYLGNRLFVEVNDGKHTEKFVEDVLRDVVLLLRNDDKIDSFEVECESLESIHNHSAWAYQSEG